ALRAMGGGAVLLKGGHLEEGAEVVDRYADGAGQATLRHPRQDLEGHGTGCTLAAAVAAGLCLGKAMPVAVADAVDYVGRALRRGIRPGRGPILVLDHFGAAARLPGRRRSWSGRSAPATTTAGPCSRASRRHRARRCCGCRRWAWSR